MNRASLVQWLEYLPSKQVARVRFPDDAPFFTSDRDRTESKTVRPEADRDGPRPDRVPNGPDRRGLVRTDADRVPNGPDRGGPRPDRVPNGPDWSGPRRTDADRVQMGRTDADRDRTESVRAPNSPDRPGPRPNDIVRSTWDLNPDLRSFETPMCLLH